jgi:hypothetical protein
MELRLEREEKYALARAAMERLPAYLAWSGLAWFGYERWTMV